MTLVAVIACRHFGQALTYFVLALPELARAVLLILSAMIDPAKSQRNRCFALQKFIAMDDRALGNCDRAVEVGAILREHESHFRLILERDQPNRAAQHGVVSIVLFFRLPARHADGVNPENVLQVHWTKRQIVGSDCRDSPGHDTYRVHVTWTEKEIGQKSIAIRLFAYVVALSALVRVHS
jgi:hypothetical protein